MDLLNVVANLDHLDSEATIYAAEPWSSSSAIMIVSEPPGTTQPIVHDGTAYAYFLEVFIAREVVDDFGSRDPQASCERLISYAMNDA
jgi:hypothetical protein